MIKGALKGFGMDLAFEGVDRHGKDKDSRTRHEAAACEG